ncbi:hypothetical protein TVTCOM_22610 [Terrisporobacter vanillatitrophus]
METLKFVSSTISRQGENVRKYKYKLRIHIITRKLNFLFSNVTMGKVNGIIRT